MSITNEIILEELKKNKQELKSLIEAVEVRITLKIEDLNRKINTLQSKNAENTNRIESLERKSKENNIIIFGLESKPDDITIDFIKSEIKKLVDVTITESDLNNFYPLGKTNNSPIKIEFTSFLKKAEVLKNARNLKGTRISIARDLTLKQRQEYNILRRHLNLARGNKEEDCYIKGNRLYVNGRIYKPEDLEDPEDIEKEIPEKPHSAPGTPIQTATKELQRQISKRPEPSAKTPQQKNNTPTQLANKITKEVGDKQKIRTRSVTGK